MGNKSKNTSKKFVKKTGKKSGKASVLKKSTIPKELRKLGVTLVVDYKPVWKPTSKGNIKTPVKPKITVKKGKSKSNKGKKRVILNAMTGNTYTPKEHGKNWKNINLFSWETVRYV